MTACSASAVAEAEQAVTKVAQADSTIEQTAASVQAQARKLQANTADLASVRKELETKPNVADLNNMHASVLNRVDEKFACSDIKKYRKKR